MLRLMETSMHICLPFIINLHFYLGVKFDFFPKRPFRNKRPNPFDRIFRFNTQTGNAGQECTSEEALAQLAAYKYSSVDNSLLTHYVLRHYVSLMEIMRLDVNAEIIQWNWFVRLMPLWLAPNMVTLIGFFFIIANVGLLAIFMPDLVGPVRHCPFQG